MKKGILILLLTYSYFVNAQNSANTIINNWNTSTIISSDGSVINSIHLDGQTIQINPNGSSTIIQSLDKISIQTNPDGTITNTFHNGNISTQINFDGTISTIIRDANSSNQINSDGSTTIIDSIGTPNQTIENNK